MKIIFLKGKHNCGKTTTLNLLYDTLKETAKVIEPRRKLPGKGDFECVLQYNNKKVAIFSLGDYSFAPAVAIGYYTRAKCDILVLAYSLSKYIHKNGLFEKYYSHEHVIVEKTGDDIDVLKNLLAEIE